MSEIIKVDGKDYVKMGDKLVEVDHFDENGKPVLKTWSESKTHPDGRIDCTVHVECIQIAASKPKIKE